MAKKTAVNNTGSKTGKQRADDEPAAEATDDNWDDSVEFDERWLNTAARDKERSRIQRQMRARRELERLRDEKHLRQLVADWPFED